MSTWSKKMGLFSSLLLLWVALTGRAAPAFIVTGSVVSALVVSVVWRTFFSSSHKLIKEVQPWKGVNWIPLLCFIPCLFFDLIKSSWSVSLLALRPRLSLSPAIVQTQSRLTNKTALVFLANHITLTPGTLTMDIDVSHHRLFVHVLTLEEGGVEVVKEQISHLESRMKRIMR